MSGFSVICDQSALLATKMQKSGLAINSNCAEHSIIDNKHITHYKVFYSILFYRVQFICTSKITDLEKVQASKNMT